MRIRREHAGLRRNIDAQLAGRTDSEVFFEALALNAPELAGDDALRLLAAYSDALGRAFEARRDLLTTKGRLLPGAKEALTAVARLPGVLQTVLTGPPMPNWPQRVPTPSSPTWPTPRPWCAPSTS